MSKQPSFSKPQQNNVSIYDRLGKLSKYVNESMAIDKSTSSIGNLGNYTPSPTGKRKHGSKNKSFSPEYVSQPFAGIQVSILDKKATERTINYDKNTLYNKNDLDSDDSSDISENSDTIDTIIDSLDSKSLIDIYSELPPPSIPMIPFKFFEEYESYDLTNREHFNALKVHLEQYVDLLHEKLDIFDETNESLFSKNAHDNHKPTDSSFFEDEEVSTDHKEQPTTIQLLKALEKANRIVNEVERSHKISQYKAMKQEM